MNNFTIFINNLSGITVLMFVMCLIGLAAFCIWLLCRSFKKIVEEAREAERKRLESIKQLYSKEWVYNFIDAVYLKQGKKIDKVYKDIRGIK
jgi:hypothetical protein